MPRESDFVRRRSRKVPDRERNHNCRSLGSVTVQSVNEVVFWDSVPILWSDTSENSSDDTESGEGRAERDKPRYDIRACPTKPEVGKGFSYYNPKGYVGWSPK